MVYWEAVICFEKYSMHDNDTMHDNCFETVQSNHQHYKYTIATIINIIFTMMMINWSWSPSPASSSSLWSQALDFGVNLQLIWFFVLRIDFWSYIGQAADFWTTIVPLLILLIV